MDSLKVHVQNLQSSASSDRLKAVAALGQIGDPRAVAPLCARLGASDSKAAAEALVRIGKPAVAPLCVRLGDSDLRVRLVVAEALALIGGRDALPALRTRLRRERDHDLRDSIRRDIQRIETATAHLKDVPLPAHASSPGRPDLPLPAVPPLARNSLPVPAGEPEDAGAPSPPSLGGRPSFLARLGTGLRKWRGEPS